MPATRFAILNHRVSDGEHWDLLIERPEAAGRESDFRGLATWQLAADPLAGEGAAIAGTQLADHRMVYLEYEGPVSGDRGTVRRIEDGTCEVLESGDRAWRFRLRGRHLRGLYGLTLGEAGFWSLLRAAEDD